MNNLGKSLLLLAIAVGASHVNATEFRYRFTLSGNVPYDWEVADPIYGDWTDKGSYHDCSNWSPSSGTVGKGVAFTQTATDCQQDQTRTVTPQQKDQRTGKVEATPGAGYVVGRTINVTETQVSVGILENWSSLDPTYTSWIDTNALYGCTSWSPDPSVYTVTTNFTQSTSTCKTDQSRQRQDREQEKYTSEIRNSGAPVTENQTLTGQSASRPYAVTLGNWTNKGTYFDCTNWSPDVGTEGKGVSFTQTATDCKLAQERTRNESYVDNQSGKAVAVPKANEARTLVSQTNTQQATGTREDWVATSSTYTPWTNVAGKSLYSCSNWAPGSSGQTTSGSFTQTATNCQTDQTRARQDREIEANTGEIRNTGSAVTEAQTLNGQTATRQYTVNFGAWSTPPVISGCSNWSPDPSTVTINQAFVQTATDCTQTQTRSRNESYIDHLSGNSVSVSNTTESQSATTSSTRTATGTKQTWAATSSTYTSWTTTKAAYNCSNWSPDPSTVTINQSFTQTATDCSVDQTRTRQDRQVETTTGEIRNNGSAVTESQTLTGQSNTRTATGTKETWVATTSVYSAWTNSGAISGCTSWTPSPSNYTTATQFTQTGTGCSVAQTRTRQDREVETTTQAVRNNGAVVTESQTAGGQTTTRSYLMDFNAWADSGGYYNCSAYSPAASSVSAGTTFTQTATCSINQTRGAAGYTYNNGWVADPAVPYRTETQTITRQVSQNATGTLAPAATINSISATKAYTWQRSGCGSTVYGVISWSGSNVSSYTITGPTGTIGLGTATSYSTITAGTYTLYAYNAAGAATTAAVGVTVVNQTCSPK